MSEERGYSGSAIALGFILGGALGASLAMLFAPESGRRTRERLRDLAADARDKTIDVSDELRDKAEDVLERGREVFEEKMKRLTTELSGQFKRSHELETEIRKNLENIGFKL